MADNLTTFMCRFLKILGSSTSWTAKGLSRSVMGFFFLLLNDSSSQEIVNLKHRAEAFNRSSFEKPVK